MPRHNGKKGTPQHPRGHKKPRSMHRNLSSPGLRKQVEFLERTWQPPADERRAA